jgi:hypothetical protein
MWGLRLFGDLGELGAHENPLGPGVEALIVHDALLPRRDFVHEVVDTSRPAASSLTLSFLAHDVQDSSMDMLSLPEVQPE